MLSTLTHVLIVICNRTKLTSQHLEVWVCREQNNLPIFSPLYLTPKFVNNQRYLFFHLLVKTLKSLYARITCSLNYSQWVSGPTFVYNYVPSAYTTSVTFRSLTLIYSYVVSWIIVPIRLTIINLFHPTVIPVRVTFIFNLFLIIISTFTSSPGHLRQPRKLVLSIVCKVSVLFPRLKLVKGMVKWFSRVLTMSVRSLYCSLYSLSSSILYYV